MEGWTVSALPGGGHEEHEERLLAEARAGNRSAFEGIYRLHAGRVYATCRRLTGSVAEAEDLTQETFLRAWQRLPALDSERKLGAWLRRVAVNLACDGFRARRSRGKTELFDERFEVRATRTGPRPGGPPGDLEEAISALPDGARTAFVLFDVYGYRHEEIAALTGMAVGTSKAQVHRARRLLRRALEP
jgi:RNA polymerase sigma-70 factor (ECF subfamily)